MKSKKRQSDLNILSVRKEKFHKYLVTPLLHCAVRILESPQLNCNLNTSPQEESLQKSTQDIQTQVSCHSIL